MLQDKLKHIKNFKSLIERNRFQFGSTKVEVVRDTTYRSPGKDLQRKGVETEKGNCLIGYGLMLSWLLVIGCP